MHADENDLDLIEEDLDIEEFDEFGEPLPTAGKAKKAGDEFGDDDIDMGDFFNEGDDM